MNVIHWLFETLGTHPKRKKWNEKRRIDPKRLILAYYIVELKRMLVFRKEKIYGIGRHKNRISFWIDKIYGCKMMYSVFVKQKNHESINIIIIIIGIPSDIYIIIELNTQRYFKKNELLNISTEYICTLCIWTMFKMSVTHSDRSKQWILHCPFLFPVATQGLLWNGMEK